MRIPATARYNPPGYRERFLSDMLRSRFTQLLREDLSPEAFVRASLGALEADFRRLALIALAEWSRCDIVSPELFNPVAALQRPSWGSWNGLLTAIRAARRSALRSGSPEQRRRVEAGRTLTRLLTLLDEPAGEPVAAAIEPLADFVRAPAGPRVKLGAVLAMPISLRNRVAHDVPTDPDWWQSAADALRPLIEFQSSANPLHDLSPEEPFPPPWFLEEGGEVLAFHGVDRDFAALYTSDAGVTTAAPQRTQDVLLAFSRLLGKAAARETDFRRLLTRLAPQEIRGVTMGDWLVGPPVGQGGFAQVHVARQLSTGRKAAIKILRDGMDAETQQRFQQEASFLSRFRHPNIVNVYGFGQETWSAPRAFSLSDEPWFQAFSQTAPVKSFIAMEWIDGQTLDDVFVAGRADPARRPPLRTLVRWMTEAAGALSAVHATGLIHRDIKPHNLMVTAASATTMSSDGDRGDDDIDPRQVKLMDFGIARQQKAERTLVTERGRWLGTPAYMSPEQVRAGDRESDLGPAADIYSLCATFYELITGRRLFEHDRVSADEVQTSKLSGRLPDRPGIAVKGLPWEIETILLGGLEPEPSDRYRSMDELARDLQHWLADEPITYRKPSAIRRAVLAYRRNRTASNLVAGFLLVAMIGVIAYIVAIRAEQDRTREQRDLAIRNERIADEQRAIAIDRERDARQRLAELQVRTGDRLLQEGDAALALLWYTRALPLTADVPDADAVARLRVALTLRQLARPIASRSFADPAAKPVLTGRIVADGKRVIVGQAVRRDGGIGGRAAVLDAATCDAIAVTDVHEGPALAITADDDGSRFATIAEGGTVRVYDGVGKTLSTLRRQGGITQFGMDRRGSSLYLVTPRTIEVIDVNTGEPRVPPLDLGQDVQTAAFSGDGGSLLVATIPTIAATASVIEPGTVRLIDVASGKTRGPVLRVPQPRALDIAIDAGRFAVGGDEGARVFAVDGAALTPPLVHAGPAISVQLSPDGKRVATSGSDRLVRVWKVERNVTASIPLQHPESAFAMAFSDDGTRLLTLAYDGRLRLWDAATGRQVGAPLTLPDRVLDAVSPTVDPDRIHVLTMAGVTEWSYAGFADPGDVRVPVMSDVGQVAFDPTSTRMACNSATGRVRVLRVSDGSDFVAPLIHPKPVSVVQFAPDGRRLLTAADDGTARVWALPAIAAAPSSPATGPTTTSTTTPPTVDRPAFELHHRGLRSAMFHPDGTAIVTVGDAIRLWNATTGDGLAALLGFGVRHVTLSADGRWLAAGCSDGRVLLWDWPAGATPSPKPTRELNNRWSGSRTCAAIRFSPDGRLLLAAFEHGPLRLWNVATGELAAEPQAPTAPQELAFSRDGRRFLAAGFSQTMHLYDTASPAVPSAFVPGGTLTSFGVFHPNGHAVYAASMTGRQFFDLRGQPLGLPLQSQPLGRAEVSPDGRWLATIDQSVRLFDLAPDRRPPADLKDLASLLAGRTIDDAGVVRSLDAAGTAELRKKVMSRTPEAFSVGGGRDGR